MIQEEQYKNQQSIILLLRRFKSERAYSPRSGSHTEFQLKEIQVNILQDTF